MQIADLIKKREVKKMNNVKERLIDRELYRNGEGYVDPTAYEAIVNAEYDAKKLRVNRVISIIHSICRLAGFKVEERIILRDEKTGEVWR